MNLEPNTIDKKAAETIWGLGHHEQPKQTVNGHRKLWGLPIQLDSNWLSDSTDDLLPGSRVMQAYEFEGLLVDILARFVNLPAEEVDREMDDALYRVCEFLGVERAGLWRQCEGSGSFVLAHHRVFTGRSVAAIPDEPVRTATDSPNQASNISLIPLGVDSKTCCQWITAQVKRGKTIVFCKIADLPEEAAQDKEALSRLGTQSSVSIPLLVGGEVCGMVTFEMVSGEKTWPELLIRRLEFAAEVFAHATSRTLSDERLRASEAQLSLAAASANAALWSLDLQTMRFQATAKAYELLQLKPGSELTFEGFLQMVHTEDRERVRQGTQEAIRTRGEIDVEFRVVLSGAQTYWVSSRGRCQYSSRGTPERLMGASVNITERKQAESLLRESETRFRTVADSAPVLLWMSGPDKLCNFFNKPWLDFTGRTVEQELGNGWIEGVHPEDQEHCMQTYATAFDAREPFSMQYRLRRQDGQYRWILDNGVPRYDPQSNFAGYIGSGIDITERKIAEEALAKSYAEIKQLKDRLPTAAD